MGLRTGPAGGPPWEQSNLQKEKTEQEQRKEGGHIQ